MEYWSVKEATHSETASEEHLESVVAKGWRRN